jgi:preprotein translocase subunit SecA
MLKMRGVGHNVLNAKMHKQEAQIVEEAGKAWLPQLQYGGSWNRY